MTGGWRRLLRLGLICLPIAVMNASAQQDPVSSLPLPTDIVEETGISLVLLDVEVRDKQGRPLPGLTAEDFTVILNGRERPIYSVDDLCQPAAAAPDTVVAEATTGQREGNGSSNSPARAASGIRHFALYLDFSQLKQGGRLTALAAAARWVRETMEDGDRAQIATYTSRAGLRLLTGFTTDRESLLTDIERIRPDMDFYDEFPTVATERINCCDPESRGCSYPHPPCLTWAWEEYQHMRDSLNGLRRYLVSLETLSGRKALLLFHQAGSIFPYRKYGIPERRARDEVALLDEVGVDANLSQTVIYPAFSGDGLSREASSGVNFGANLADFTGGKYNRGDSELAGFLGEAGREFACLYRIGLIRPEGGGDRVYRAKILVRDRALDGRHRVRFLDEIDRWWRRAQAELTAPERATDVRLTAAVVPISAHDKSWKVELQVAIDLASLVTIPRAAAQQGEWEVGALLSRGNKVWEMLAVSRLRAQEVVESETFVVHAQRMTEVPAGSYRLGAFARDRTANLFGADQFVLDLPDPRKAGVAGPLLMLPERPHMKAALPLMTKRRDDATTHAKLLRGRVPLADAPVSAGEKLDLLTLICPGAGATPPPADTLLRYVTREDDALFRFSEPELERAGRCFRFIDSIETQALEPGVHAYRVSWKPDVEQEPVERQVSFHVLPAASDAPATESPSPATSHRQM